MTMLPDKRLIVLLAIIVIAVAGVLSIDPVAQDPGYHHFADQRGIPGVPNIYNVLSNLPFVIVGAMGIRLITRRWADAGVIELNRVYWAFFAGVLLTGFGSAYYHYDPGNATLLWDRLPMTVAFMALFDAVVGEYIALKIALKLFYPLLALGIASVVYWHISELHGNGDLRAYGLVQFLPVVLIPLIMWLYASRFNSGPYLWGVVGAYALAKLCEFFDAGIYVSTGIISGHTLKHLLGAFGAYLYYCALRERKIVSNG